MGKPKAEHPVVLTLSREHATVLLRQLQDVIGLNDAHSQGHEPLMDDLRDIMCALIKCMEDKP
jgi:hypothetical protein